jgi:hypothetical protein
VARRSRQRYTIFSYVFSFPSRATPVVHEPARRVQRNDVTNHITGTRPRGFSGSRAWIIPPEFPLGWCAPGYTAIAVAGAGFAAGRGCGDAPVSDPSLVADVPVGLRRSRQGCRMWSGSRRAPELRRNQNTKSRSVAECCYKARMRVFGTPAKRLHSSSREPSCKKTGQFSWNAI